MGVRDIQMRYTIDNPKLVTHGYDPEENNFTGVVKDKDVNITYYENGLIHRIDGPAVIWADSTKWWWIHGKCHREDGPAVEFASGDKLWYYNNTCYGGDDDFTVESWIKKCKLEVFK